MRTHSVAGRLRAAQRNAEIRSRKFHRRYDHLTVQELRTILEAQGYRCAYCPNRLVHTFELDHFIPFDLGGLHIKDNIKFACPPCNHSKKHRIFPTYRPPVLTFLRYQRLEHPSYRPTLASENHTAPATAW
jgi:5-methylcytosine-specific restriction endonuclease McrA